MKSLTAYLFLLYAVIYLMFSYYYNYSVLCILMVMCALYTFWFAAVVLFPCCGTNNLLSYPIMSGSWQTLHVVNTRSWKRRCSPSYPCLWQAVCLEAMFPLRLATPVGTSPLQSPRPSPLPPPFAAALPQVHHCHFYNHLSGLMSII